MIGDYRQSDIRGKELPDFACGNFRYYHDYDETIQHYNKIKDDPEKRQFYNQGTLIFKDITELQTTIFILKELAKAVNQNKENVNKYKEKITISLTTYPGRINQVYYAIKSLMIQSIQADKIILWLAEEQFPNKKLPDKIHILEKLGLTIRWCDDLRSHKKYYYAYLMEKIKLLKKNRSQITQKEKKRTGPKLQITLNEYCFIIRVSYKSRFISRDFFNKFNLAIIYRNIRRIFCFTM